MNIYKIAELAKVSPSTVSKVINGKEGVGEETRNLILRIVRDNNYTPKISTNKQNNIAVLFRAEGNIFDSEFTRKILKGISDTIFERNYNLLLLPNFKIPKDKMNFKVFCHEQRIMGCIFLDLKLDDDYVNDIAGVVPIVLINAKASAENVYSVCSNDFKGAYQAMNYFYEMGHRKIAIACVDMNFKSHKERMDAYTLALKDFRIPYDKDYIINMSKSTFTNFKFAMEYLEQNDKMPTSILVMNDQEAIKVISYLNDLGKRVPDDVSIIGFDDYDFDEHIMPPLTTVRQELHEMGKKAFNILVDSNLQKQLSETEKTELIFNSELIVRRSVKRL